MGLIDVAPFLLSSIVRTFTLSKPCNRVRPEMMRVKPQTLDGKQFIKASATGEFDLEASKEMLKMLLEDPAFSQPCDILIDLREAECELTVVDIFELVGFMVEFRPYFSRRIAVLVSGQDAFEKAHFMELCAENRGFDVQAFDELSEAEAWLGEGG